MTKAELVNKTYDAVSKEISSITKKDISTIIDKHHEVIHETLIQPNEKITIQGVGILKSAIKKGREMVIPWSGQKQLIPSKKTIKLTVASEMKNALNPKTDKKTKGK